MDSPTVHGNGWQSVPQCNAERSDTSRAPVIYATAAAPVASSSWTACPAKPKQTIRGVVQAQINGVISYKNRHALFIR